MRLGVVAATQRTSPLEFDSFVTEATVGPDASLGFTAFVQEWGTAFRQGFAIRPTVDVLLHGARWWHPSAFPWRTPPHPQIVTSSLWVAPATPTTPAIASTGYVGETGDLWAGPAHWETIMFPTPVALTAGVVYDVSMSVTTDGLVGVSRQEAMFTDGQPSIGGLLEAVAPTSRYDTGSAIEETPFSTADAWYWLDPLVTAA